MFFGGAGAGAGFGVCAVALLATDSMAAIVNTDAVTVFLFQLIRMSLLISAAVLRAAIISGLCFSLLRYFRSWCAASIAVHHR
jgi:hypothetical protein